MNDQVKQWEKRADVFKRYGLDIFASRRDVASLADIEDGTILDVGTGRGFLAVELAKRGHRLTSVDIDRGVQRSARAVARAKGLQRRIVFKVMDCRALKFKDASFDYVLCADFFHHLTSPVRCLKEIMRVTGKTLVISDLNKSGARLFERVHAAEGRVHDKSRILFEPIKQHLRKGRFSVKTYRKNFHTILVARKDHR